MKACQEGLAGAGYEVNVGVTSWTNVMEAVAEANSRVAGAIVAFAVGVPGDAGFAEGFVVDMVAAD